MAPEQAHGAGAVSHATDVWAFGVLAFEMLTGVSFWRGAASGSPAELFREVLVDPIPRASERAAEELLELTIPPGFDSWLARCVTRNPSDRFSSVDSAVTDLRASLGASSMTPTTHVTFPGVRVRGQSVDSTIPRIEVPSTSTPPARKSLRLVYRERFGRTIAPAAPGQTLLEVSIENEVPHQRVCGGKARCTTCRVYVHEGGAFLEGRTDAEARVAAQRGWSPEIRLACQARIRADAKGEITVRRLVLDREDADSAQTGTGEEARIVERTCVVLCVRLDGLASFAARHLPYDAMHVTTRAFRSLSDLVHAQRGDVLSVHGGRLIASFGSRPEDHERAALDAVRAAVRMQARLASINDYVGRNFGEAFTMSIGAAHGALFSGELHEKDTRTPALLGEPLEIAEAIAARATASRVAFAATSDAIAPIRAQLTVGEPLGPIDGVAQTASAIAITGFSKPDVNFLVQTSFETVAASADDFARRFYDRLFSIAPEVRPLFAHVDMDVQRKMLIDALALAVRGLDDIGAVLPTLRELGKRHVDYGVKIKHYRAVGEALLWALEEQLGTALTPELHLAWMEIYGTIARTMIDATRTPAAVA